MRVSWRVLWAGTAMAWQVAAVAAAADAAKPSKTTTTMPCTASSTSGAFYDLRPDMAVALAKGTKPKTGVPTADYTARGYDYGANFTINICAPVVKPVANVLGIDRALWANVSAYYEHKGEVVSLGQQSSVLVSRGRELVLQYTGGSPCAPTQQQGAAANRPRAAVPPAALSPLAPRAHDGAAFGSRDHERDVAAYAAADSADSAGGRRKSATFAFLCDRDPLDTTALVSFVGTPDECAYFFKIRSSHACAGAEPHKPGSVGPGGVFAIIFGVALLVYFIGGVVYQRTVAHARGWRQLPNYTVWVGIWSFVRDLTIILTSSCTRYLPHQRGYRTLSGSPAGHTSSRNRDDENRLIDQLDEEWDD